MRARNVSKGDWIQVGGKPVKVTNVKDYRPGKPTGGSVKISYRGGSKSGTLGCDPDLQVSHLVSSWWRSL